MSKTKSYREIHNIRGGIKNIAKGTTDPRVEFISQFKITVDSSQILNILQFQNLD